MPESTNVAVCGAGYVGSAFATFAHARGAAVWAVRRSASQTASEGVQWLQGDVTSARIAGLPERLDAIVLAVAPSHGTDGYDNTYPPAAAGAVALARETGASRLIYTSSTGVYGGRDGEWVMEDHPRDGQGGSNDALRAAEDIVLSSGLAQATVMRVAGIYGPSRDPRRRMQQAEALAQRGQYWTNLAHRDDIVAAIGHLLTLPEPPTVVNCSDGSPTRAADVARWLTATSGSDPEALRFGNDAARSRNDQRVSNALLVSLGWQPRFPSFREGFTSGL